MSLSVDQQKAVEDIVSWVCTPNEPYFILQGAAGTGKTTVLKKVADSIYEINKVHRELLINDVIPTGNSMILTATTNEAALNLSGLFPYQQASSIHKLLQIQPIKNKTIKVAKYTKTDKKLNNLLVVIDEASMIDEALFAEIKRATCLTTKILFVGDALQLPPVEEDLSIIFKSNIPVAELTTNFRQLKPTLSSVVDQLREYAKSPTTTPTLNTNADVQILDADTFKDLFVKHQESTVLLSYTNRVVEKANHFKEVALYGKYTWVAGEQVVISGDTAYFLKLSKRLLTVKYYDEVTNTISFDETQDVYHVGYSKDHKWIDISKQHAMTIHRSQGRQFKNVFLNLSGFIEPTLRNRLLYVAASRATEKLYVFTGK